MPTAMMTGPSRVQAFSMQAAARVLCASLARAATSGSDMKQTAVPPNLARAVLLMPTLAIFVSVTMVNPPFFRTASVSSTTWSLKRRLRA